MTDESLEGSIFGAIVAKGASRFQKTRLYKHRFFDFNTGDDSGDSTWHRWYDNHGYWWMKERMDQDEHIFSIIVEYDDGSKLEQRVHDGTEPWEHP